MLAGMNIFILDADPVVAATYLCDKHVPKMALEAAQLAATCLHLVGVDGVPKKDGGVYKPTHKGHPCRVWASETRANFEWLVRHGLAICDEHRLRGGKPTAIRAALLWALPRSSAIPGGPLTPHALAVGETPHEVSAVGTYRAYYLQYKADIARWRKGRPAPAWWA